MHWAPSVVYSLCFAQFVILNSVCAASSWTLKASHYRRHVLAYKELPNYWGNISNIVGLYLLKLLDYCCDLYNKNRTKSIWPEYLNLPFHLTSNCSPVISFIPCTDINVVLDGVYIIWCKTISVSSRLNNQQWIQLAEVSSAYFRFQPQALASERVEDSIHSSTEWHKYQQGLIHSLRNGFSQCTEDLKCQTRLINTNSSTFSTSNLIGF